MGRQIYVETRIRAPMDQVWQLTQDPAQHQRWDLRFTEIHYQPRTDDQPQRFTYALRLPGRRIAGVGQSIGERDRPDGSRTSALRFWSDDPLSLIRSGSGYWRYVPTSDDIRFLTGYDYTPGEGRLGRYADVVFRPLLGLMTAWSFDRLRLWLEAGVPPERALRNLLLDRAARGLVLFAAIFVAGPDVTVVAGIAVLLALFAPPSRRVPRASRCLRRAPDGVSGRAPATMSRLDGR